MGKDKDKDETEEKVRKALKGKAAEVHPKGTLKDIQKKIEERGKGKGKDEGE